MKRLTVALLTLLAGCGGGGGGGGEDDGGGGTGTPTTPNAARGVYRGMTNDGRSVFTTVLGTDETWSLYSTKANDNVVGGVIRAAITAMTEGDLVGEAQVYSFEGLGNVEANVSGSYSAADSLTAVVDYTGTGKITVNGDYVAYPLADGSDTTGNYSGTVTTARGSGAILVTLFGGQVTGSSSEANCDFGGELDATTTPNVFNILVRFEGGINNCGHPNVDVLAKATLNKDTGELIILGNILDSPVEGIAIVATKNPPP